MRCSVTETKRSGSWVRWVAGGVLALGLLGGGGYLYWARGAVADPSQHHEEENNPENAPPQTPTVQVVTPVVGGTERVTQQPGSVQAYEMTQVVAEVSGYLQDLKVDIGSKVKAGQTLAVIAVPDLKKAEERQKAACDLALARVEQVDAQAKIALAEVDAAEAAEVQSEAAHVSATKWTKFRKLQESRMKVLAFKEKAIEEVLYEEAKERYEAAQETERAAKAAIAVARANKKAKEAHVEKSAADRKAALAEADVARAEWEKAKVLVDFATIKAPYDGVITQRNVSRGDLIRSAISGGNHTPLLVIESTEVMRVVVQVPDRDARYADKGDTAFVELDALPGQKFEGKISRIADSEDPQTRLMRVEIHLANPTGQIRSGMFGQVRIILEKSNDPMTIPLSCLVGPNANGRGKVYVARNGKAALVPVELGASNGTRVGVRSGLTLQDQVISNPNRHLHDGAEVEVDSARS
jgi:RND family efflux transporter MFP subunit